MPLLGDPEARTDVAPHPVPTVPVASTGEDVESRLKPGVETLCDLDGFMPGMICGQQAVNNFFLAHGCEVIMEFNHGHARGNGFRSINLDLIVVLSADGRVHQGK